MKNIIVVDDEPHVVAFVVEVLEREGYPVITAPSGEEAFALLDPEQSWLLIVGASLPDMDGDELLRRLDASIRLRAIMLCHPMYHRENQGGGMPDWRLHFRPEILLRKDFDPRELAQFVRVIYRTLDEEEDPDKWRVLGPFS